MKHPAHALHGLLYLLAVVVIATFPAVRALRISPLYLDAAVRDKTEVALRQISTEQGWLLSDMELREVTPTGITFMHREHRRLPFPPACFTLSFATSELRPCAH